MKMRILSVFIFLLACNTASAQNYSGDARKIAMGGTGYYDNIAGEFIEEQKRYRSIAIPLGLIQLVQDLDKFDFDDEESFDPLLAFSYVANPIHYSFDRDTDETLNRFVTDIVYASLDRDLNTYRGITLTNQLEAEGLLSRDWGVTVKFLKTSSGSFHGLFIGAGPYVSARTNLNIDEELTDLLKSPTYVDIPDRTFDIYNQSVGQLALSITGGYRGKIQLNGSSNNGASSRNSIYLAMNYHYLWGFRYEDIDLAVQLETDSEGLLTLTPESTPFDLYYLNSRSGRGFALDFGFGVVLDRWEFGFGANGIGNRINWKDLTLKRFTLDSVLEGGDLIEEWIPLPDTDLRVELPVQYSANIAYNRNALTLAAQVSHGYQDMSFHGGAEYRLGILDFRGGVRYGLERWHPTTGIGLNLGRKFSIDAAAFWNTTNIERALRPNVAVSLRFNKTDSFN